MKNLSILLLMIFAIGFLRSQNKVTVKQFGVNVGSAIQLGKDNNATIQQGFQGSFVSNNYQPVHLNDWIEGSYIIQTGKSNTASTTVHTSNNGTSILQLGNLNIASQDVGSFYERTGSITRMGLDI